MISSSHLTLGNKAKSKFSKHETIPFKELITCPLTSLEGQTLNFGSVLIRLHSTVKSLVLFSYFIMNTAASREGAITALVFSCYVWSRKLSSIRALLQISHVHVSFPCRRLNCIFTRRFSSHSEKLFKCYLIFLIKHPVPCREEFYPRLLQTVC